MYVRKHKIWNKQGFLLFFKYSLWNNLLGIQIAQMGYIMKAIVCGERS